MKQVLTKITISFIFSFGLGTLHGQQFKWVKGGGTNEDFSSSPSNEWERTEYMCTDADGNIYALSQVGNNPITADTFYKPSGAYGADQNILVTSYNCNGQMRWAKLLASNGGEVVPFGVTTDNLGNVYIAGRFTYILHIGYDTVVSGTAADYQATGIIQLDTNGNYKWIRFVGNNTFPSLIATGSLDDPIAIDGLNNIHYFCYIQATGLMFTPGVASTYGVYDMTYNTAGTLLSAVRLEMDSAWYLHAAVIDPVTNKLYVCGEINQEIYGGVLTDTFYAAAFDASRNLLWQYFCGHGDDDGFSGITLSPQKNLYFSGASQGPPTFSFNGDSVSGAGDMAIVMKTDTNGHVNWIKHYDDASTSVNGFSSIALLPNNKIVAAGTFAGAVTNGTVTLSTPPGEGYSPYFVVLDSGGDLQTIQQIHGDGFYNSGNTVTSDKVGNIYVGGNVVDSIWAGTPPIPEYNTVGGNTDFFVMKYGVDCSCASAPIAAYTDTGTHTIGLTYTGTSTGIDSIVWNFGDGSATVTGATAIHTYSVADTYRVCVTVYTECGSDIHCSDITVMIPTESSIMPSMPNVKVYPNPANDELNITGLQENAGYRMLSVTGMSLQRGILQKGSSTISMKDFSGGIYILEMVGNNGEKNMVRIIKE